MLLVCRPSPKFGASRTERINSMSPAAQRLASMKLGIRTHTDKALKASYTPSPSRLDKTPTLLTPSSKTPNRTPKSARVHHKWGTTPKGGSSKWGKTPTRGAETPGASTPKQDSPEVYSLTDNLLNLPKSVSLPKRPPTQDNSPRNISLPKRPRAEDYF